jgi:glycerate 2-kinase
MIAAPAQSLAAAAKLATEAGYQVIDLGDRVEGEAREVAGEQAARALAAKGPAVILSGGETTVTIKGKGRGGRNAEFALALAIALDGKAHIAAIAGDTDGIDGSEDNAGALVTSDTLARAGAKGLDAKAYLANNDAYSFFAALDDLIVTGPTRTNVNDFRAILVEKLR